MVNSTGQVGIPPIQINPLGYTGSPLNFVPAVSAPRDPTSNDVNYVTITEWTNTVTQDLWKLYGFINGLANWKKLATGSVPGGTVLTLSDNAGTLVSPTVLGNIQLAAGAGITTVATPASNLITIALSGGGIAFDQINVDANTAPGTDPVVPDPGPGPTAGQVTITGAQVAAGTVGANVIRTDSLAANTYTIEIQRSTAVASTASANNGVSHFSSFYFSVDANGFVTGRGGSLKWQTTSVNVVNMVVNNGYICIAPGGALTLGLPATATIGDVIEVTLDGATSFQITQAAGQQIRVANSQTTLGATGSITTTASGDTLRMVAQSATKWNVLSYIGNLTVA